jgi:transcription initiation factor TFIID subunit 1
MDWSAQEAADEADLQKFLNGQSTGDFSFDISRPLDPGEKADDAEDFEDISDDDLPDEEEPTSSKDTELPGLTDDGGTSHDMEDDLFGDMRESSPLFDDDEPTADCVKVKDLDISQTTVDSSERTGLPAPDTSGDFRSINFDAEPKQEEEANQDLSIPAPAENEEEFLKQAFPGFEKSITINWNELLPPKKAHYIPKQPLKAPKPVNPTKVSLDLAPDTEKSFRTAGPAQANRDQRAAELASKGFVPVVEESADEGTTEEELDWSTPPPDETIGNVSWADLQVICDDWESRIEGIERQPEVRLEPEVMHDEDDEDDEWFKEMEMQPAKRQKVSHTQSDEVDILNVPIFAVPSFDDFERATRQLAKKVVLDLNDPHLLVDVHHTTSKERRLNGLANNSFKRGGSGNLSKSLISRFNFSNDEAYDALKENHQNKVRALIGNITVEHSMPAIKLQWPYYRVKLGNREARSYHRPSMKFAKFLNYNIFFHKPAQRKRKHMKGLSTQDIFKESKDLSLADNSTAMLLEYSEEHPMVLSNFGMGNRIINYYRRLDADDMTRPKGEIGETSVLMPEDRSPFAQFGSVDPGETVPTLHNAMYRAPVFKQEAKNTDFLVIRSTTGIGGTSWHIRNIDHVYVVGQQLPSTEIPGPQSRKVTNASKNRMKMIAFRKIRHNPGNTVRIDEITAHIAESTDMQNRQKLKEFIKYYKDEKVWRVKPGEAVPDEPTVRSWVKPEDVCVIDAMQVGLRHLEDAGYSRDNEGEGSDEEQEGDSLEQKLAPWKTSKNFLDASAGKAMLQLHGEGDPSGCGLAISFIKTSMKGGYLETIQGPQATSEDAIARERKANGGHKYNVDKQYEIYSRAIRDIWEKQKANLSNTQVPEEGEEEDMDHPLEREQPANVNASYTASTPVPGYDDNMSTISRYSTQSSRKNAKAHRIIRTFRDNKGRVEEISEVVTDPRVWREYMRRRHALDAEGRNVYEVKPTGDPEWDRKEADRYVSPDPHDHHAQAHNPSSVRKEIARLERNKERRLAREKQKGLHRANVDGAADSSVAGSPAPGGTPAQDNTPKGTARKCANCGQVGHIKTNKKLCPMLNGTMKPEDVGEAHGFGAVAVPSGF